jgi:hypothetical protein
MGNRLVPAREPGTGSAVCCQAPLAACNGGWVVQTAQQVRQRCNLWGRGLATQT